MSGATQASLSVRLLRDDEMLRPGYHPSGLSRAGRWRSRGAFLGLCGMGSSASA